MSCEYCKFAKEYPMPEPKEFDSDVIGTRTGWRAKLFGKNIYRGPNNDENVWSMDISKRFHEERIDRATYYIECRLNPKPVKVLKTYRCSHYFREA